VPRTAPRNSRGPAAARATAQAAAVALLARRDFACAELRARLLSRGFQTAEVTLAIDELAAAGTLDDGRYAQHYVAYHAGRGQGPVRIAAELRRLGVAAPLIEAALATGPDWTALARKVCRAKFGEQPPGTWTQQARQARFLQYRGFASDQIRVATGTELDGESTEL
jgi:regulatory protein